MGALSASPMFVKANYVSGFTPRTYTDLYVDTPWSFGSGTVLEGGGILQASAG